MSVSVIVKFSDTFARGLLC